MWHPLPPCGRLWQFRWQRQFGLPLLQIELGPAGLSFKTPARRPAVCLRSGSDPHSPAARAALKSLHTCLFTLQPHSLDRREDSSLEGNCKTCCTRTSTHCRSQLRGKTHPPRSSSHCSMKIQSPR
ncbi:hypothetical protein CHARACLAT_032636 [Characodon lateralis]|uniref:Uncharacterized protein n=1 Tax=Characodon lateralis TaxID=208331 RepID=A0ABU7D320_9TELE|nr:hypothetical protein [Characodon lateralis]